MSHLDATAEGPDTSRIDQAVEAEVPVGRLGGHTGGAKVQDIYQEIVERLRAGQGLGLASLVERQGSAPGSLGAKMIVSATGEAVGSIGGGCVEAEVWDAGREVQQTGDASYLRFRLNSRDMAESGLICGGNVGILVEPLDPAHLPLYEAVLQSYDRGGAFVLTSFGGDLDQPGPPLAKVLVLPGGEVATGPDGPLALGPGAATAAALAEEGMAAARGLPPGGVRLLQDRPGGGLLLVESVARRATVFVFGAGHLAAEIIPLAARVHFRTVVIDDRPMFANEERFPDADEVVVAEFDQVFDTLSLGPEAYVVIVTRGHLHDMSVLEQSLRTDAAYVGMVGSRAKLGKIYATLEEQGFSRERLAEIHAPIGLDIGAKSPEEIAVSVVSELIKVRSELRAVRPQVVRA